MPTVKLGEKLPLWQQATAPTPILAVNIIVHLATDQIKTCYENWTEKIIFFIIRTWNGNLAKVEWWSFFNHIDTICKWEQLFATTITVKHQISKDHVEIFWVGLKNVQYLPFSLCLKLSTSHVSLDFSDACSTLSLDSYKKFCSDFEESDIKRVKVASYTRAITTNITH